jgi:hypothetical protein
MCLPTRSRLTLLSASPWRTKTISGKTTQININQVLNLFFH